MVNSPCNKVCKIDLKTGLCAGCKRTESEIIDWIYLNDIQKKNILKKINIRKLKNKAVYSDI